MLKSPEINITLKGDPGICRSVRGDKWTRGLLSDDPGICRSVRGDKWTRGRPSDDPEICRSVRGDRGQEDFPQMILGSTGQ